MSGPADIGQRGPAAGEATASRGSASSPEPWLRGPLEGVDPFLMPAAHALLQSGEDLARACAGLTRAQARARPGGAASIDFHLRHIAGSIDRLLSYAEGRSLSEGQRARAAAEEEGGAEEVESLLEQAQAAIRGALARIRATQGPALLEARLVGRARLPSTVLGLLFHVAEHTQRHTGQVIATAQVVRGR